MEIEEFKISLVDVIWAIYDLENTEEDKETYVVYIHSRRTIIDIDNFYRIKVLPE